jgi:putative addiction module CopG family antidote
MGYALAKENEKFIERMIRQGRFNNQSEVVREALRRMEREENNYLNPSPLTDAQVKECFGRDPNQDAVEHAAVVASAKARRQRTNQGAFEDL